MGQAPPKGRVSRGSRREKQDGVASRAREPTDTMADLSLRLASASHFLAIDVRLSYGYM